ncbi:unnamed protein product [Calicophoron daubneyi]|uniref:Serine/threonine-protein phosphatase 6 regulatory ankyrin repeat subunit A n=1 Tax=Calicophoron daubneyi TaxID=300641 RepID=A0AAV2T985_CALDB
MSVATFQGSTELVQAIFCGNEEECARLLNPESANYQDAQKRSVLHAAAHCGEGRITELLLKEGARVNTKDSRWLSPLHRACASNASDVVRILLAHGADRNARDKAWQTPLHVAAANASVECIELLLAPGESLTNVNASDRTGHSPLHHAVYGGHVEVVRLLLEKGASVSAFDKRDRRAMHWAAACGYEELIELLHQFGAEVNCRDQDQYTPLHAAAALGHTRAVTCLIRLGAELDATTAHGNTALHVACLNGREDVVDVLLAAIADRASQKVIAECHSPYCEKPMTEDPGENNKILEASRSAGFDAVVAAVNQYSEPEQLTPIHMAVSSTGGALCLRHLLDATTLKEEDQKTDDNLEKTDDKSEDSSHATSKPKTLANLCLPGGHEGSLPLHMAALHGRFDRAQLLLSYGAVVDARDRLGNTALHIAADHGHELFVHTVLQAGCRWDIRGQLGSTALHRAAMSGFASCLFRLFIAALANLNEDNKVRNPFPSLKEEEVHEIFGQLESGDLSFFGDSPAVIKRLSEIVGIVDDDGRNLVHAAALGANLDCLKLVLFAGGDPFTPDSHGRTPLHYAIASCAFSMRNSCEFNTDNPGSLSPRKIFGGAGFAQVNIPTYRACAVGDSTNAALVFLKLGADVNAADECGCTPLHLACAYDISGALVRHLLMHGSNPLAITSWPSTPPSTGYADSHHPQSVTGHETQIDEASECTRQSSSGGRMTSCSPLHIAVSSNNTVAVSLLLQSVSSKNLPDYCIGIFPGSDGPSNANCMDRRESLSNKFTPSPFLLSASRGKEQIMKMLLEACLSTNSKLSDRELEALPEHEKQSSRSEHVDHSRCWPGQLTTPSGHTPLHLAAHAGHTGVCRLLLDKKWQSGTVAEARDSVYRWNALHHAADQGHSEIVALLLEHVEDNPTPYEDCPADTTGRQDFRYETDEHGRNALMLAAQNNHPEVIRLILLHPAPSSTARSGEKDEFRINMADVYGRTALHRCVANGHLDCVKLLLSHGADATMGDFRQRHAIHMAATCGKVNTLSFVLDHLIELLRTSGEPMDGRIAGNWLHPLDQCGFSPLHFAAYRGHASCIRILLHLPCYQRLKGNIYTPLHCATQNGHKECLELLLNRFGDRNLATRDAEGRTILHLAAICNQGACMDLILSWAESQGHPDRRPRATPPNASSPGNLIRLGKFVSQSDNAGRTALMVAASVGANGLVDSLLSTHSRLIASLSDSLNSDSPISDSDRTIMQTLVERLSLGIQDADGSTALHHACTSPDSSCGLAILEYIDDNETIKLTDHSQRSPLHLAIAQGLTGLVEALISRGADLYAVDNEGRIPALSCTPSIQVATCLSLSLAAMFPPIEGCAAKLLSETLSPLASVDLSQPRTPRNVKPDQAEDKSTNIMSTSVVAPKRTGAVYSATDTANGPHRDPSPRPLSYPGSESDFF